MKRIFVFALIAVLAGAIFINRVDLKFDLCRLVIDSFQNCMIAGLPQSQDFRDINIYMTKIDFHIQAIAYKDDILRIVYRWPFKDSYFGTQIYILELAPQNKFDIGTHNAIPIGFKKNDGESVFNF